ncbi:ubiquinol-cytochrome-c reductase complex assembly factor 2-like [Centruroides sculpturatus]|uniref:ubiquinol-cytochrome-c reductase complex assembly factor 2-like n=1 Tax=Centruroides sculpturatus TaxID=218467 RepID=UPI000C6D33F3|nr:ubiquinol-cytochrome-c reductase complex assembly factor 2-like [Centruroides sculpturatus]
MIDLRTVTIYEHQVAQSRKMASTYSKYMRLCKEWRIDDTKTGRDLGQFIKKEVLQFFRQGEGTKIKDEKECERYYQSLHRIMRNEYGQKYKLNRLYSATGLTHNECKQILSTEYLTEFKDKKFGLKDRILSKFS